MRRQWMALGVLATAIVGVAWMPRAAANQPTKKVLFFTKSEGFQHSVITRKGDEPSYAEKLMTQWGPDKGFQVTCTKDGGVFTPEGLAPYDVIMFYTTGNLTQAGTDKQPPMPANGKQVLLDAINGGKGFVGLHCASDTFHSGKEADPYITFLGGEFAGHGAQQKSTSHVVDKSFPGFADLPDSFDLLEEWYTFKNTGDDIHVLLMQDTAGMKGQLYENKPMYPATWARMQGKGRVFYSSMGHREDIWTNPIFQKVLFGGLNWAARNTGEDVTPNVRTVAPNAVPPAKG